MDGSHRIPNLASGTLHNAVCSAGASRAAPARAERADATLSTIDGRPGATGSRDWCIGHSAHITATAGSWRAASVPDEHGVGPARLVSSGALDHLEVVLEEALGIDVQGDLVGAGVLARCPDGPAAIFALVEVSREG